MRKEKVMSSISQKRRAAPDTNHLTKEDAMKTGKTKKVTYRGPVYITLAAGFLVIIAGLIAQPVMAKSMSWFGQQKSPDEIVQTLTDRLDLTAEQVEAIRPIITEKHQKMNEIRGKSGTERREGRKGMQKLKWDTNMKLGEILTEEQVDRYLELRHEQRGKKHRGKFGDRKMKRGFDKTSEQVIERLSSRLKLSEEQEVKIAPIIKESIEKRKEIFDKYRDEGLRVKESMRSEMQNVGDKTHAQLSTILDDSQIKELNALKEERRERTDRRMHRIEPKGF